MSRRYSLGIDFGTLSARVVLVDVENGDEVGTALLEYKHGVIDEIFYPTKEKLPPDFALQDPDDYFEVFSDTIPQLLKDSGVTPDAIIGIGIDFTSCSILPVNENGKALCTDLIYRNNPHSWVKLWKHHAAQKEADFINEIAQERNEPFLSRYGGKLSSEWMIPKVLQILNEAPEIYEAAHSFMEGSDWITMQLTGVNVRNSCAAGYKETWSKREGYPSKEFFRALDPRLEDLVETKLNSPILPIGSKAGGLTAQYAQLMGLKPGIAVSVGNVDAHVAAPAMKVVMPGKMLMIMGTSTCHLLLSRDPIRVKGIGGLVEDGIIPGFFGYEAGQAAVGDCFEWFVENQVPAHYLQEAQQRGLNIYTFLEEKAAVLKPGESGLLALDWWNGNRAIFVDSSLSGLIVGLTLSTKPEEIYRALIEATAFGTNVIVEAFRNRGVAVDELYVCGGLPEKNKMLVQIYADVTNMEIHMAASSQTPALGAAIFGAVAAGKKAGGYDNVFEAAEKMSKLKNEVVKPIPKNVDIYKKLYHEYKKLHDYFGEGRNNVMKLLRKLKSDS